MRARALVVLVAACNGSAPPQAPVAQGPVANVVQGPPKAPGCIAANPNPVIAATRLVDGALVACYIVEQPGDEVDDCWRFDLASRAWSYVSRLPHPDVATAHPVTATATAASVCKPDGSDCKTVKLSGMTFGPDDQIEAATNADRSIIAVWASGPVYVFDAAGTRLATVKPWPTDMNGKVPSVFRSAHVLGSVLEVRIADTPVSSAFRLYDARTGKKLGDVFNGQPMNDGIEPVELGGTHYAFVTFGENTILVVDVATAKQLASYPLGDDRWPALVARAPDGNIVGVAGTSAYIANVATGKLSFVAAPICAK